MSVMALAQNLQSAGRGGDTILAHITPEEAQLLKSHGGSGTINPVTGLPEFGFFSDLWNGFKKLVKAVAPIIIPAVAIFVPTLIPAIGTALGASATLAPIVGAAALSAGVTLASGGSLKQVLTSAALAGTTAYLTPIVGKALAPATASAVTQTMIGSAVIGGGITALRGGTVKEMMAAAATGAASAYLGNLAQNAVAKINNMMQSGTIPATVTEKGATDAVFLAADAANLKAAGLTESQIASVLKSTGANAISAEYAAASVTAGMSADTLAANIAAGGPTGVYSGDANTKSITAGNNTDIVQRVEDAKFVAEDAVRLAKQGISQAEISKNLQASGVSVTSANAAAASASRGLTADQIANNIVNGYNYLAEGKVYTETTNTIDRVIGQAMTPAQEATYNAIPYKDSINAGKLTIEQANVLSANGYTPADVSKLTDLGYSGGDLSNMAGAGVTANTLTNLANTPFQESQINGLFQAGASANDISAAGTYVNQGKLSAADAVKLLGKDLTGTQIYNIANSGAATAVANSNLDSATVNKLLSGGWDLNRAAELQGSGTDVNKLVAEGKWTDYRGLANPAPAAPTTETPTPKTPVTVTPPPVIAQPTLPSYEQVAASFDAQQSGTYAEDLKFIAQDAANLRAQGLTSAQIKSILVADGASDMAAGYAASYASQGYGAAGIEQQLASYGRMAIYPTATQQAFATAGQVNNNQLTGTSADADFIAADAKNLYAQGLTAAQVKDTLIAAGVTPAAAAAATTGLSSGWSDAAIVQNINRTGTNLFNESTYLASVQKFAPENMIATRTDDGRLGYYDPATGTVYDESGNIISQPVQPEQPTVETAGPGGLPKLAAGTFSNRVGDSWTWDETRGAYYDPDNGGYWTLGTNNGQSGFNFAGSLEGAGEGTDTGSIFPSEPDAAGEVSAPGTDTGAGTGQIVYSDGTTETTLPDGTKLIDYADGSTQVIYPDGTTDTVGGYTPTPTPVTPTEPAAPGAAGGTEQPTAPVEQPVAPEAPVVEQPVVETPTVPTAPAEPVGPPAPTSDTYYMPNGEVVIRTPFGTYTPEGGLVHPNPDWAINNGGSTTPPGAGPLPTEPVVDIPPITPEVIDAANRTDDPIGAINDYVNTGTMPGTVPPGAEVGGGPAPIETPTTPGGVDYSIGGPVTPEVPGMGGGSGLTPPTTDTGTDVGTGTVDYGLGGTGTGEPGIVVPPITGGGEGVGTPGGVDYGLGGGGTNLPETPVEPEQPPVEQPTTEQPTPETPVEPGPYIPLPDPIVPDDTGWAGWGPIDPLAFKHFDPLALPGLNPGLIEPPTYYTPTSKIQSQYTWGQHPYQPGPTFSPTLYNQVAAPVTPWGLQQMYTPTDINAYLAQLNAKSKA